MITLSEDQVTRLLIGRKAEVSVGEPWDFESADGKNRLEGRIAEVLYEAGDLRSQRIVVEVTPFEAEEGSTVERLVASRRYKDATGIVEQVASGRHAPANFSYEDQVNRQRMPEGVSAGLIGSLQLAD